MISQMRDITVTFEIPIVYGMVISERDNWLEEEINEIVSNFRANLERAGFLYKDHYYKADCEMGTIIIWAELPQHPEKYVHPKLGNFWFDQKKGKK